MENKNIFPWVINGLLAIAIVIQFVFPFKKEVIVYKDKLVRDTLVEYVHDTITRTNTKTIFRYDTVLRTNIDTIFIKDTSSILSDYFASKRIVDTLSNDSLLYAKSEYTLERNSLVSRTFEYKINKPTTMNVITPVPEQKGSFWIGLSTGGNENMFSLRPQVAWLAKNNFMYGYGYDIINNSHNISVMKKISFKNIWQRSKK